MVECIVCNDKTDAKSIEHIVPESMGNKNYVLPKGALCDSCNNRFSKFENKALSNSIFAVERARGGIKTKRGRTVKGRIGELKVEGSKAFLKDEITVEGLNEDNLKEFDPKTRRAKLYVKSFDKSEVATSRFLLMLGIESIFKSRPKLYDKVDWSDLRAYLTNSDNKDWPFITSRARPYKFTSIPTFLDKYRLKKLGVKLEYYIDDDLTLFKFHLRGVEMIINLSSRSLSFYTPFKDLDDHTYLYPEHFRKKI